jgi:HlyD family secretion protein
MNKKFFTTAIIWAVVIAIVLLSIVAFTSAKRMPVQYTILVKKEALETVLANGKIAGSIVVPLSFQQNGVIAKIFKRAGDLVKAGDTLMLLDTREQANAVKQRSNDVEIARINLARLSTTDSTQAFEQFRQASAHEEMAKKQLDRVQTLVAQSAMAQADLDKAKSDYAAALSQKNIAQAALASVGGTQKQLLEVQIAQSRALLEQAQINLSKAILRAPENGKIVNRFAEAGQLVIQGTPVLSFLPADTTTHVELQVDEDQVSRIRPGQKALVGIASDSGKTFDAVVRDIIPFVDASRGTATVQLAMALGPAGVLPDQTVTVQIITGTTPDALILEQRFISFTRNESTVYILRGRQAKKQTVKVQDLGNGTCIVSSGLTAGDTVLSAPGLTDGKKVTLTKAK